MIYNTVKTIFYTIYLAITNSFKRKIDLNHYDIDTIIKTLEDEYSKKGYILSLNDCPNTKLIGLTDFKTPKIVTEINSPRGFYNEKFLFVLFHEYCHVKQYENKKLIKLYKAITKRQFKLKNVINYWLLEQEANNFAAKSCIKLLGKCRYIQFYPIISLYKHLKTGRRYG